MTTLCISECTIAEDDEYRLEVLIHLPNLVRLDKDEYLPEDRTEAISLKQKKEEDAAQKLVSKCREKVEGGKDMLSCNSINVLTIKL